ncbi:MAG TPA: asparaginase [Longimicrobiaceae bacterium]|nr:asparaginase [Longimicrobiaceae bacterium]
MADATVDVVRGTVVESRHRIHAAVVDSSGVLRASVGNPELTTFFRSAAKPFQVLPLVEDGGMDRFGFTLEELALCCGSHSGEDRHVRTAESILFKVGLDGEALECGPHAPFDKASRRDLTEAGLEPMRLHNNCSGKHAGMMALARVHGWEPTGYHRPEHPVQQRVLAELVRWVNMPPEAMALGTDGCGVVCFGLPLYNMALAYSRLAKAYRLGEREPTYVVGAMVNYPEMVAGDGRLCTDLMQQTAGRVFAKTGAEGLYCVGIPGAELGIAMKVEDGSSRAVGPAVLAILRQLDLISEDDLGALASHAYPECSNTRGETVGHIRCSIPLRTPDA